jgi:hypothetical protein
VSYLSSRLRYSLFLDYFTFHLTVGGEFRGRWWEHMPIPAQRDLSGLRFDVDDSIGVDYRLESFFAVPEPDETPWVALAIVLIVLRTTRKKGVHCDKRSP